MFDNGCTETNCPVHMRVNKNDVNEFGELSIITYRDKYAVFTYSDVDETAVDSGKMMSLLMSAFLGGQQPTMEAIDEALPMVARHAVYRVGYGALSDVLGDDLAIIYQVTSEHDKAHDVHAELVFREKF